MIGRTGAAWRGVTASIVIAAVASLTPVAPAQAAIVAPVPMGTAVGFSVLGASTVTNTGDTVLAGNLGLSPGTSITGFPPGVVLPPSTIENTTPEAAQAQSDLTIAYLNAQGRPINAVVPADLGGLILPGGVYAALAKGPLGLTGTLVLDGQGDPASVFIFQTDTTLTTATMSAVSLINGAQECNVFWQVGSSATLGTDSVIRGSVMALESVTVTSGAVVHGRALARNAAVTLDTNTFLQPTCATAPTTTTSTTTTTMVAPTTTTMMEAPTTTTTTMGAPTTTTTTLLPLALPTVTTTTKAVALVTTTTSASATSPAQVSDTNTTPTTRIVAVQGVQATAPRGATTSITTGEAPQELPRTGGAPPASPVMAAMVGLLIVALCARSAPWGSGWRGHTPPQMRGPITVMDQRRTFANRRPH